MTHFFVYKLWIFYLKLCFQDGFNSEFTSIILELNMSVNFHLQKWIPFSNSNSAILVVLINIIALLQNVLKSLPYYQISPCDLNYVLCIWNSVYYCRYPWTRQKWLMLPAFLIGVLCLIHPDILYLSDIYYKHWCVSL